MRNGILLACLLSGAVSVAGCESTGQTGANSPAATSQALPARPADDLARDAGRKPFQVLDFLGVQPGMTVLDVIAAGGYYTEVLANAVGPDGQVYAQNPSAVLRFRGGANDRALSQRLLAGRLPNVRRLDRDFNDLGLVANSVDVAITALNFHDIYNRDPAAASQVLLSLKTVLKPGGVLGIIDHVGAAQADNASLHRIDPALVTAAAQAAGFEVTRSELLANAQDDHTQSPFAPGIRGKTDRFVLKLTKPQ